MHTDCYHRLLPDLSAPTIVWGTAKDSKKVINTDFARSFIIESNLASTNGVIQTLGPVRFTEKKEATSRWNAVRMTIRGMYKDGIFWQKTAELVYLVGLGALLGAVAYLVNGIICARYQDMSANRLFIYLNNDWNRQNPLRSYGWKDFTGEALGAALVVATCASVAVFHAYSLLTAKDSFYGVYHRIRNAFDDSYLITQDRIEMPAPSAQIAVESLANNKIEDGWEDPLSLETITQGDLKSPKTFIFGAYALSLDSVLKQIFRKDRDKGGHIAHPIEIRHLSASEQRKFVQEFSAFFCIDEAAFLDCWNSSRNVKKIPSYLQDQTQELLILSRLMRFMELLPHESALRVVAPCLLESHRYILQNVSLTLLARLGVGNPYLLEK